MAWLWVATAASCLIAVAALVSARSVSHRLRRLSEQYWELKFEHGELKARVRALAPTAEEKVAAQPRVQQTFVPLAGLKRSNEAVADPTRSTPRS